MVVSSPRQRYLLAERRISAGHRGTGRDNRHQAERFDDIPPLIEGNLILLCTYLPPQDAALTTSGLQFQRFYALRQAGEHDRVWGALLSWLKTGELGAENQAFIGFMADQVMLLAEGANINTADRLNDARMAVTFTAGLKDPNDYRLGLALRVIDILERSAQGQRYLHLALTEQAWNRSLQDNPDLALAFFQRADPATWSEQAATAVNRARIYLDTGQPDLAKNG